MIETKPFGATGHESSRVIFGAAALWAAPQHEADGALELLLEHGINHIDTAASYGDAELRLAPWMREHRDRFFLATKTGERSYAAAREEIRRSLERMAVDSVDLIQLHCLVHPDRMGPRAERRRCAARRRSRRGKKGSSASSASRAMGSPSPRCTEQPRAVRVRLGAAAVQPRDRCRTTSTRATSTAARDLPRARHRGADDQGIARGPWGSREHSAATWYEPLVEQAHIDLAVHWVLGDPGVFLNSAGDLEILPRVLDAAERFASRPGEAEMAQLLSEKRLSSLFA